ncbi:hypothetical protein J1N35_002728 [Gossypium stocksii]|uniref:Reverse transcriptase zinc-binding domain-containing protein n=1 Tax=Gossypium stocksii TaxID=47602 RepID=A0A9D3WLJ9_9ROSI|nr:hypothetical protein J1N35_002728 [Gossypium stocksii]
MRIKYDHQPFLVDLCPDLAVAKGRPFRFLVGWVQHQNFPSAISNLWKSNGDVTSTLEQLTTGLKKWNTKVFGHIGTRKREITKNLRSIQHALERTNSTLLIQKEIDLREKLEEIFNQEELLWKQKSRCDWLKMGDRNTKFFIGRMLYMRKFNRIEALRNANGEWLFEPNEVQAEAIQFFQTLYGEEPDGRSILPPNHFPQLDQVDINFLGKAVSNEEIKSALFNMAPLKAPGSDGYHALFFQNQWSNIGENVRCWEDPWIPKLPLKEHASSADGLTPECRVKDMVTEEGAWDISTPRNWLTEDIIQNIINILPLHPLAGPNRIYWNLTSNGKFTVKSAYHLLKENTWNDQRNKWANIWKFLGPQRVRFFLWLVYKQRLLTNLERVRRGISQNEACPSCIPFEIVQRPKMFGN